jgi:multidrug efflux pump subunit AcrB
MMSAALILFGAIGFSRLPVRQYPDVDSPIVSVTTVLRGANPRVIETTVTDVLEEELSTIPGIRTLTSSSAEQFSNITIEFTLSRDLEEAAQDVRDKVSRVRGRLPQEVEEPVVTKQDSDAQPFMWLALSGENYDLIQLSVIADRVVKTRLQAVDGVGQAQIHGERRPSMRVWLSASELATWRFRRAGSSRSVASSPYEPLESSGLRMSSGGWWSRARTDSWFAFGIWRGSSSGRRAIARSSATRGRPPSRSGWFASRRPT